MKCDFIETINNFETRKLPYPIGTRIPYEYKQEALCKPILDNANPNGCRVH